MYYNASREELQELPIKNLKKMQKEIKFELNNMPENDEELDAKKEFLSMLEEVIKDKKEIVNEDATGGSGGSAGAGTAYATAGNVAGMGSIVSAQPSSQAGAASTGDGTEGSGDIGVPLYTYSKNAAGMTGNKAIKMGNTKGGKRKDKKLTAALADFVKRYKGESSGKVGKTTDGKLMNYQDFIKDDTEKVTKVKESIINEEVSFLGKLGIPNNIIRMFHRNTGADHDSELIPIPTKAQVKGHLSSGKKIVIINKNFDFYGVVYPASGGYYTLKAVSGGENLSKYDSLTTILSFIPGRSEFYMTKTSEGYSDRMEHRGNKEFKSHEFVKEFKNRIESILRELYGNKYNKAKEELVKKINDLSVEDFKQDTEKDYMSRNIKVSSDKILDIQSGVEDLEDLDYDNLKVGVDHWLSYLHRVGDFMSDGNVWIKYPGEYSGQRRTIAYLNDIIEKVGMDGALHMYAEYLLTGKVSKYEN